MPICQNCGVPTVGGEGENDGTSKLIGKVIGERYLVESVLGQGGMGTVFRGRQQPINRPVAIKVMHPVFAADEDAVKRFEREAKLTSRLNHPHTIQLFDFGLTDDGLMYLVMELLQGRELEAEIKAVRHLPVRRALALTLQAAKALKTAHALDIVHRDLKPGNMFLVRQDAGGDHLKIMDFGIAKTVDDSAATQVTKAGVIVGTPAYMSPEQAKGGKVGANSDIYSLGIILYEMLTGAVPFSSDSMIGVLMMQVSRQPDPLAQRRPELAGLTELQKLLDTMLTKDAARRPGAAEVVELLTTLARDLPEAGPEAVVRVHGAEVDEATAFVQAMPEPVAAVAVDGAGVDEATAFVDAAQVRAAAVRVDGAAVDEATAFVDAAELGQDAGRSIRVAVDGANADAPTAHVDSAQVRSALQAGARVQVDGSAAGEATAFVQATALPPAPPKRGRPQPQPSARPAASRPAPRRPARAAAGRAAPRSPDEVRAALAAAGPGATEVRPAASETRAGRGGLPIAAIAAAVGVFLLVLAGGGYLALRSAGQSADPADEASAAGPAGADQPGGGEGPSAAPSAAAKAGEEDPPPSAEAGGQAGAPEARGDRPEVPSQAAPGAAPGQAAASPARPEDAARPAAPPPAAPALAKQPPKVQIISSPPGATVAVEGVELGKAPLLVGRPAAGASVSVTVRLARHRPETVRLTHDQAGDLTVALKPLPRSVPKPRASRKPRKKPSPLEMMME